MKGKTLVAPRFDATVKSIYGKIDRTPKQRAEEDRIQAFAQKRPSLKAAKEFFEFSDESLPTYVLFQVRLIVGALRKERERQGLTLEQLSQRCGIDPPALSRLERHEVWQPTMATLWDVAHALGLDFNISLTRRTAKKKPLHKRPKARQKPAR